MRFSCTKENLSQALALVGGVTSKNTNLPILSNVLLRVDQQKVEVVATNLELAIVVSVRAKIEQPGLFTIPARTLAEFVGLLPPERVDLALVENELVVSCGKSTTKIKGSPADEFPIIPTMDGGHGFVVQADTFKTALSQTLPAVAKTEIRPELAGIFFGFNLQPNKELVVAATDSYRLAERKLPLTQGTDELRVVVPGRTAQEINHTLSVAHTPEGEQGVRLLVTENQLGVHYNGVQIISRLVEGNYPDYTQIIPKDFKTTALVSVDQLSKELKAAGLFTTSGVNAVTLTAKPAEGVVQITSASSQTGEYASQVGAEITGETTTIVLNHRYVLDGLANISTSQVLLKIINGDSPCVVAPDGETNYLYIVMPIRQ